MSSKQPRILLFHIAISSGHKMAAEAVAAALQRLHPSVQTVCVDSISLVKPLVGNAVKKTYLKVIQSFPELWEYLYFSKEVYQSTAKFRARVNEKNARTFARFIEEVDPDAVVCTQAYPCGVTAAYKRMTGKTLPLVGVVTDYVAHAYWFFPETDLYMVPTSEVAEEVATTFGVDQSLLVPTGIPIHPDFMDGNGARARDQLGIPPDEKLVMIMGGGNGLGSLAEVTQRLDKLHGEFSIVVIAGKNDKLYRHLRSLSGQFKRPVRILGYVNNIRDLMMASNLLVTKPGGMTTAESLAAALPMVLFDVIPGQEARNCSYLLKHGIAVWGLTPEDVARHVDSLISNDLLLNSMTQEARSAARPQAACDIASRVLDMIHIKAKMTRLETEAPPSSKGMRQDPSDLAEASC